MAEQTPQDRRQGFLDAIDTWYASLSPLNLADVAANPAQVAVFCVDLTVGFCYRGPLSSPRVAALVPAIVRLFRRSYELGVRSFVLSEDQHTPDAVEFDAFPPHSVTGTEESRTVPELTALPFSALFQVIPKNSIHPALATGFDAWIEAHPEVETCIVVGDCTDLCVYQLAMHLRLQANACGLRRRVIVLADCVDTYDLPVEAARQVGAFPHDGDLLHRLFLYHMALNQIEVAREMR